LDAGSHCAEALATDIAGNVPDSRRGRKASKIRSVTDFEQSVIAAENRQVRTSLQQIAQSMSNQRFWLAM
jgi:hypothetical protein